MKKEELLKRINEENLASALLPYTIELDNVIHNASFIYGYGYENGKWKVYENNERRHQIVFEEFDNESDAVDELYDFLKMHYRWAKGDY